jgi:ribosomal-protein-alanine N-acetyltransferase
MVQGMAIRPLQSADLAIANDLLQQLGYDIDPAELATRIDRVLSNTTHFAAVAEEAGAIRGLVHAYERPALEKAYEVVVQSLVVDRNVRNAGLGMQLMTAVETWAKARGAEQVVLHTRVDRADARLFYERIGYSISASSHLMAKSLAR